MFDADLLDKVFINFEDAAPSFGKLVPLKIPNIFKDGYIDLNFDKAAIIDIFNKELLRIKSNKNPLIIWGTDEQSIITELIPSRSNDKPIIFLETNPMFKDIFILQNLELINRNKNIYFIGSDLYNILFVKLSDLLSNHTSILPDFDIIITPSELEYIFRNDKKLGCVLRFLIASLPSNYWSTDFNRDIELKKVPFIYSRLEGLLKLIVLASPGISTLNMLYENRGSRPSYTQNRQTTNFSKKLIQRKYKKDKVSIIILAWNQWSSTEKCIKSIFNFSYNYDFEVIVVDNASTDDTPSNLKKYQSIYPALKVIRASENLGPAGGRDLGTLHSKGEYLIYLDNDTEAYSQTWISNLIQTLKVHPSIGGTGAFAVLHTSDSTEDFVQIVFIPGIPIPVNWVSSYCSAFKRQAIIDAGGWRPDLYHLWGCEDFAMGYALRDAGWITVSPLSIIEVTHLIQHREGFYSYDFNETARKNTESFRKIYGERRRLKNAAISNEKAVCSPLFSGLF
ncbi:MAG: glycosyltransferase [Candidatus Hydrogenedentota bacterium]